MISLFALSLASASNLDDGGSDPPDQVPETPLLRARTGPDPRLRPFGVLIPRRATPRLRSPVYQTYRGGTPYTKGSRAGPGLPTVSCAGCRVAPGESQRAQSRLFWPHDQAEMSSVQRSPQMPNPQCLRGCDGMQEKQSVAILPRASRVDVSEAPDLGSEAIAGKSAAPVKGPRDQGVFSGEPPNPRPSDKPSPRRHQGNSQQADPQRARSPRDFVGPSICRARRLGVPTLPISAPGGPSTAGTWHCLYLSYLQIHLERQRTRRACAVQLRSCEVAQPPAYPKPSRLEGSNHPNSKVLVLGPRQRPPEAADLRTQPFPGHRRVYPTTTQAAEAACAQSGPLPSSLPPSVVKLR